MKLAWVLVLAASVAHADTQTVTASGAKTFDPAAIYKVPLGSAPRQGPADAPVTIVVWSDYACGYCNRVQDTLDKLNRLYPGQLRWVHRVLPLDEDNTIAAEAVLAAAAQGRFTPMHQRLFALHGHVDRFDVELIARELGLDMTRFRADLDTHAHRAELAQDIEDARVLGISGTPSFFINGRPVNGARSLREFADVVDQELARAAGKTYDALVADGRARADVDGEPTAEPFELDAKKPYKVGLGLPGHQKGSDAALVTIVEWSDFQCPFCAREAPVLAKVQAKYGDAVRLVYRHYPVQGHRLSMLAAEAGVAAADQGKFWAFHDLVFGHFGHLSREDLDAYAKEAGLDMARFDAALDSRRYHDAVVAEAAAGDALGVDGTPTMFINGQPLVGARDEATLEKYIDAHLDLVHQVLAHGLPAKDIYALIMSMATGNELADPSSIPDSSVAHVELRETERCRAVEAACRRHDGKRAQTLGAPLTGDARKRVLAVCAGEGIDL